MATLPVALGRPVSRRHVLSRAAAVVTTSQSFDQRFRELTGNTIKTTLIPNFGVGLPETPLPSADRRAWLALGRFSPEKGFAELIQEWPQDQALVLIGEGYERGALETLIRGKPIEIRPPVPILDLRQLLPSFRGIVFPSQWLEAAPQVVVEAARVGIPITTHARNGAAGLVSEFGAGSVYSDGPTLLRALATPNEKLDSMGRAAHQLFIDRWSVAKWVRDVQHLYRGLVDESA